MAPESFDGEAGTVVAFEVGVDPAGGFVDARTGASLRGTIAAYSRMKYGDAAAVQFFAGHLAAAALASAPFVAFCREADLAGRFVYVTSTAMFNVPSASNLLVRATADPVNIGLAQLGVAPVVVAEQTRLTESAPAYASKTARERLREGAEEQRKVVTIVPEKFRGQGVVFLDDIHVTGAAVGRTRRRLRETGVAGLFCLFALRVDPAAVAASDGTIEAAINAAVVDGSLASIRPMLEDAHGPVVQKLLRVVLDPGQTDDLARFCREIPTGSLLRLYGAAASNNYWQRYDRAFVPSLQVLEAVLRERGALDAAGRVRVEAID